jgi:periplasmic copper chaperone A
MRHLIPVAFAVFALVLPATAAAHVTIQPDTAPAGGFTRLDVRVPNERDDAGTVEVAVQMPPGIASASYEPVPGWSVEITQRKADQSIEVEGLQVDKEIDRITWTGTPDRGGIIRPGEFQDFGLSLRMPDGEPGSALTFKALQTYRGGEVVRWIGAPDADEPAPTVTLTAAEGGGHGAPGTSGAEPASAPAQTASTDDGGGSDGLAIAALVVGALGLLAGAGALVTARRTQAR